ncbi:MAG TPA: hypothetical protein ENF81_05415 [Thermotogaceae bacterium]|nr:hypothetical protein [Thermotogaceae bacterium]
MVFNPLKKPMKKQKRKKRKKIDNSFKIIIAVLVCIVAWAIFLTIKSMINYKEVLKVYEVKKKEYELLREKLESKEKELEILRKVLQEYESVRDNNILQTKPSTSSNGEKNSK